MNERWLLAAKVGGVAGSSFNKAQLYRSSTVVGEVMASSCLRLCDAKHHDSVRTVGVGASERITRNLIEGN